MATISWDTGSDRPGQVFVSVAGGDEELFGQGPSGARDFRRRTGQAPYQFRLYEGLDRGVMLASLSL
jgi:hypothetical protein